MSKAIAVYRRPERAPHREETWLADDRDRTWMADGTCRTGKYDPELWYPLKQTPAYVAAICQACPVQLRCLNYAWANGILHGVWGGMSADARYAWMRRGVAPRNWPEWAIAKLRGRFALGNETDNANG
jgi:WhiB family redox-sensing transcriptional regulator